MIWVIKSIVISYMSSTLLSPMSSMSINTIDDDSQNGETKEINYSEMWEDFNSNEKLVTLFTTIHGIHVDVVNDASLGKSEITVPHNMFIIRWAAPNNVIYSNPDQDNAIKNTVINPDWIYSGAHNVATRSSKYANITNNDFLRHVRVYGPGQKMYNEDIKCDLHDSDFNVFKLNIDKWTDSQYCQTMNTGTGDERIEPLGLFLKNINTRFGGGHAREIKLPNSTDHPVIIYLNTCSPGYEFLKKDGPRIVEILADITNKKIKATLGGLDTFLNIRRNKPDGKKNVELVFPKMSLSDAKFSAIEDGKQRYDDTRPLSQQLKDDRNELYIFVEKLIFNARENNTDERMLQKLVDKEYFDIMFYLSTRWKEKKKVGNILDAGNYNTEMKLRNKMKKILYKMPMGKVKNILETIKNKYVKKYFLDLLATKRSKSIRSKSIRSKSIRSKSIRSKSIRNRPNRSQSKQSKSKQTKQRKTKKNKEKQRKTKVNITNLFKKNSK
jgi:hypothetical protein